MSSPIPLRPNFRPWRRRFVAVLFAATFALTASAAEAPRKNFDLPADAAEASLKRLATQSGVEVLFTTDMTASVRTASVRGSLTALEAATRLLAGTGLAAEQDARTGAIIIKHDSTHPGKNADGRAQTAPAATEGPASTRARATGTGTISGRVSDKTTGAFLAGAEIAFLGSSMSTTAGRDGEFFLNAFPAGTWSASVSYVGYETKTLPVVVRASETAPVDVKLSPEVVRLSAFTVEGAREGQARAINQQRAATNLVNIVAADAIGNFPDVNAAEAIKRMPGVSTVRQRGEDRDITIRGAAPDLNAITIDGVSVLSNQVNGRTVSMDVYPAEQIAGVEITKSATPDMDGDSIGGAINLRSKSAFDSENRVASLNAFWQYNDLAEQSSYRTGLSLADRFGAKRDWGVQLTFSRAQRKALEETTEPAGWAVRSGTATNGPYAGYMPNNVAFTYVDIKRERTGGSFALEHKLGDTGLLFFRASHNQFIERNGRPRHAIQNVAMIANAAPVTVADERIVAFTNTSLRGQRVVNPRQFTDTGSNVAIGTRGDFSAWKYEAVGAFARGTNHQDSVTGQWLTSANTSAMINLADTERPVITRTAGPDLNDASAYAFSQLQIQDRKLLNREYSFKADISRRVTVADHPLKISGGTKAPLESEEMESGVRGLERPRLGHARAQRPAPRRALRGEARLPRRPRRLRADGRAVRVLRFREDQPRALHAQRRHHAPEFPGRRLLRRRGHLRRLPDRRSHARQTHRARRPPLRAQHRREQGLPPEHRLRDQQPRALHVGLQRHALRQSPPRRPPPLRREQKIDLARLVESHALAPRREPHLARAERHYSRARHRVQSRRRLRRQSEPQGHHVGKF